MARSKDTAGIEPAAPFLEYGELAGSLLGAAAAAAPADRGTVALVVLRPEENARTVVEAARVSVAGGVEGSGWVERPERGKVDQVCVMSAAAIRAIAGDDEANWPAAGDQVFMDLDLGKGNLKTGDRVRVGEQVVLEVTEKPHNGCGKFAKRYGVDALKIVNSPLGKERRLRGIYFKVVGEGEIRRGDSIVKIGQLAGV